jgi:hypothetical protein
LPREKFFANEKYSFCQELENFSQKNIGFAKRERICQEKIYVFPKEKSLGNKKYSFCQERKNLPRKKNVFPKEKSLANKKYRFCQ